MVLTYSLFMTLVALLFGGILFCAAWFARRQHAATVLSIGAGACVAAALVVAGFWTWFFRDGLGPDSSTSSGIAAMERFWAGFWVPAAVGAVALGGILASWRHQLKRIRAASA